MPLIDLQAGRVQKICTFYSVTKILGIGAFSEVYKAYDGYHATDVALKIYLKTDEKNLSIAEEEVRTLNKLSEFNTDYFPKLKGGLLNYEGHPVIAMELGEYSCGDGSPAIIPLKDIMASEKSVNERDGLDEFWGQQLYNFIIELCNATQLLHKNEIVHRDIKPANILLKKSPGVTSIKPFLLDFNTSVRSKGIITSAGTQYYLPPEVLAGKRKDIDIADDLWAIAIIIWEMLFGIGQKVEKGLTPHSRLQLPPSSGLIDVLLQALSIKQEDRYHTIDEFIDALKETFADYQNIIVLPPAEPQDFIISIDEIDWARMRTSLIVADAVEVLSGENELPISKDIRDNVQFIYSLLLQPETRSYDLRGDIVRLGTKAIPAIIENGYKIPYDSDDFNTITEGLYCLALQDQERAIRSINAYSISSDYGVRRMCLNLCEKLQIFPPILIENIIEDDTLYLSEERVFIADLCIRYSIDKDVMLYLNKYMCKEYILDPRTDTYHRLKNKIATRIPELKFGEKARLIVEDVQMSIWEELNEYEKLTEHEKERCSKGLLQLFADAFASLNEEGLKYLQANYQYRHKLKGLQYFIGKLAIKYMPARIWLFEMLQENPSHDFLNAAKRLWYLTDDEKEVIKKASQKVGEHPLADLAARAIFEKYLDTGWNIYLNTLCIEHPRETLELISSEIESMRIDNETVIVKILKILNNFKNSFRAEVLNLLLMKWDCFAAANYEIAVYALTMYNIPNNILKQKILDRLNNDLISKELNNVEKELAKNGIERIL